MPRIKKTKTEPIEETPVENVSFASKQTEMKDCCDRCGSCERCLHPVGNIRNYIPLLILLLIIAAFLLGALVTKVTWLQDKVTGGTSAGVTPGQQQQAAAVKPLHVAQSTGMDADKFKKCLDSGKYTREVAKDLADGQAGGVTGTPAVFVNGLLIVGAQPYSVFKTQIDKELASARTFDTLFQQLGNALTQKAYAQTTTDIPTPTTPARVDVGTGSLPALGNKDAKVTAIEFADFQCPYCEKYYTEVEKNLIKEYVNSGKIKYIFRNYAFLGQESNVAAEGSYCANEQNKFWEYHNFLYEHQGQENSGQFTKQNLE